MAAARISSVVSVSVARAEPSASSGMRPRVSSAWRAGASPEHVQVSESVVSTGTATVRIGTEGRYLDTRRAVEPPRVSTTISAARTLCAVRTADDAKLSSGVMGMGLLFMTALKSVK